MKNKTRVVLLRQMKDLFEVDDLEEFVSEVSFHSCDRLDYLELNQNNEDFLNDMFGTDMWQLACAIAYGSFNPNDDFARLDDYGNLETFSEYDWHYQLQDARIDIIDAMIEFLEDDEDIECIELDEIIENRIGWLDDVEKEYFEKLIENMESEDEEQ